MVNAGPDTIGTVLDQIISEVSALASEQSDQVKQALDDAGRQLGNAMEEAQKLPEEAVQKIKDACDPPDWWSLLLVILVEISKLDPHLSVGSMCPAGWSRMVTLTYTTDAPDVKTFTVGLAITDPGLRHGLLLKASAPMTFEFGTDLRVKVVVQDTARWTWEFGGAVEAPDATAGLDAELSWKTPIPALANPVGGFSVGPLHLHATLDRRPPAGTTYQVALGLGVPADAGIRAQLHPGQALGVLGQIVHIADLDERYSPQVVLSDAGSPQFTLGHQGL
ncbi:MAG: hypothetical protein ABI873_01710 [Marmoricola sp.]